MSHQRIKTIKTEGIEKVFDPIRKRYFILTPEEWVRQQILHFLIHELKYPPSLISVEKQIKVNHRNRRFDIVVYKNDEPWLIVECKSESEALNPEVLSQILSYNTSLKARYLAISNGTQIHCYNIETGNWDTRLPLY